MMDSRAIRQIFQDRERVFANHWLALARRLGQDLYGSGDSQAITEMRAIFAQMAEDVRDGMSDKTMMLGYCHAILPYCDLSNDWRDWPEWAEQVLQHADPSERVWLLYGLGRYMEEIGQLQESLAFHSEGLELGNSFSSSRDCIGSYWVGMHWLGMGITMQRNERLVDAEDYLLRALKLFRLAQNRYQQANFRGNLASLMDRDGRFDEAISSYVESVALLRDMGNRFDLCRKLYSLGIAYIRSNRFQQARVTLTESRALSATTDNHHVLALGHYGIAWLQYRLGELEKAKEEAETALERLEQAIRLDPWASRPSFPETQGNMYLLAGATYARGPEYDLAVHYLDRAEASYRQLEHNDELLQRTLANRARVYEHSGDWANAERLFLELVERGKRLHSLLTCGDAGVHLIRIYRKRQVPFPQWLKLMRRLGFYGLLGVFAGYRVRRLRRTSLKES